MADESSLAVRQNLAGPAPNRPAGENLHVLAESLVLAAEAPIDDWLGDVRMTRGQTVAPDHRRDTAAILSCSLRDNADIQS